MIGNVCRLGDWSFPRRQAVDDAASTEVDGSADGIDFVGVIGDRSIVHLDKIYTPGSIESKERRIVSTSGLGVAVYPEHIWTPDAGILSITRIGGMEG